MIVVLLCLGATYALHAQDTLKLVSWNVFLRPKILSDAQKDRVSHIAQALVNSKGDILCLQEVFHARMRKRLVDSLKGTFPYILHPGKCTWKQCSGLMIFSKYPLTDPDFSIFDHHSGYDATAFKGVQTAVVRMGDQRFLVANTHLQSGRGEKEQQIRDYQYRRLNTMVHTYDSLDYFVIGDFNTCIDSSGFNQMCSLLKVTEADSVHSGLKTTSNFANNGLYRTDSQAIPRRIDFVLQSHAQTWKRTTHFITRPKARWKNSEQEHLSDHAMVISSFVRVKN